MRRVFTLLGDHKRRQYASQKGLGSSAKKERARFGYFGAKREEKRAEAETKKKTKRVRESKKKKREKRKEFEG